ncbi:MAG TPA: nucleotidyltransferase family protein [Ginsengibacter sp.]
MSYSITKCAIVILAAGQSTRFGSPKQLLRFNGKSLLQNAVDAALQTNLPVIIVVGANSNLMKNELKGLSIMIEENKTWREGMSTSLHYGLTAARNLNKDIEGIIFMVSDQPFVSVSLLNNLCKLQQQCNTPIVACSYAEKLGTPVLFHKIFFEELMSLRGDTGARKLIEKYKKLTSSVPFPEGVIDIDTREDYNALLRNGND